jgi:hypothetical protein
MHNYDFRPKRNGLLHNTGDVINSPGEKQGENVFFGDFYANPGTFDAELPGYTEVLAQGSALDLGAYELDAPYYWIPGFKEARVSFPIPRDVQTDAEASAVTPSVSLMWRDAYKATEHYLFLGTSNAVLGDITAGDKTDQDFIGTYQAGIANIYQDTNGLAIGTYFWRVDALVEGKVIKGNVWQFTVE